MIVYEYQKTRHSEHPKSIINDFRGVLVTDGLEQYHKLARDDGGIENANCMAHARRHFANAVKAMGKRMRRRCVRPSRIRHWYTSELFMIWKRV